MRSQRSTAVLASAGCLALVCALNLEVSPAEASCNQIPDPTALGLGQPDYLSQKGFPFRGALGRIDGPFATPESPTGQRKVSLAQDLVCRAELFGPENGYSLPSPDKLRATIMFGRPGDSVRHALAVFPEADCPGSVGELDTCGGKLHYGDPICTGMGGTTGKAEQSSGKEGVPVVTRSFEFPSAEQLSAVDDAGRLAGAATIVVTDLETPPCAVVSSPCRNLPASESASIHFCVGEFFATSPGNCGTERADVDLSFSHLSVTVLENDFRKICTKHVPPSSSTPDCVAAGAHADELFLTVLPGGNALLAMNWETILADKPGSTTVPPEKKQRNVFGSSAFGRTAHAGAGPIHIPGKEFLASSKSHGGGSFPTKPRFDRESRLGHGNELELGGNADKRQSTLLLMRRKPVENVCSGGPRDTEACDGGRDACECGTLTPAHCKCSKAGQSAYFICIGGARHGFPCSRGDHCPPKGGSYGRCLQKTRCRALGSGVPSVDCKDDADCGWIEECGPGLFELRGRENIPGGIAIKRKVQVGDTDTGVCDAPGGLVDGVVCTAGGSLCGANVDCVRFRADTGQ